MCSLERHINFTEKGSLQQTSEMPNGKAKDYFLKQIVADYEELLGRFQQTESVRFEEFTAIWRNMGFSSVFYGSLAGNEMREFCQLTLTMAFNYFLPPYSFQIRVGGLYLLYGLYHTQLASPKEKIRIALKDWEQIQKFCQDSVNSQHYDAVYIIRKLIAEKAVFYTAMPQMLTFSVKMKPQHHKVCEEFRDRPERIKDLISTDMLQEVANIQRHYEQLKASVLDRSFIVVTQQDLPARLHSCVLEFLPWQDRLEVSLSNGTVEMQTTWLLLRKKPSRSSLPIGHSFWRPSRQNHTGILQRPQSHGGIAKWRWAHRFLDQTTTKGHPNITKVRLCLSGPEPARTSVGKRMNRRPNIGSLVLQRRTRLH